MRKIRQTLIVAFLISLYTSFVAFGLPEGMAAIGNDVNSETYRYVYEDRTYAVNTWKQMWDNWYYFGEDGRSKQNTWAEIDGKWYYFDEWSRMLHDTTTPDGYTVGSDGAWVKDGQVVVEAVTNN